MSDDTTAGGRILGSLGSFEGKGALRLEDRFDTDVEDLWSALTEPDRLRRWLGDFEGDLRLGGEFRATYFASGWEGTGRVVECEPPRRVVVTTRGTGKTEDHVIEITLTADGEGTTLVIEQRGMPLDQIAAYGAGGQVHIEDLAAYLAGGGPCDSLVRFDELFPAYQRLAAEPG